MEPNPIFLYNTLNKEKVEFKPIKERHVSMYHCGPTVYNFQHLGNLRAYINADILRRVFEFNEYNVTQIMNITDIGHLQSDADDGEDKMTLALKREGLPLNLDTMRQVANKFYDAFRIDLEELNIKPANLYPFASDHVKEDIDFINNLLKNNHAYALSDGIYFDTKSLDIYGRLGGISKDGDSTQSESRLKNSEEVVREKRNFRDFALWKFNSELGYDAEFGKGFPGWHIECSVMSMKYLGETFDIHTGGTDHISVHHNNEIAQSEAKSGKILANYWLHNEHLIIDGGKKMAKSGESFITLNKLAESGISPIAFRYWALGASYRSQLQFSLDAVKQAENAYQNLLSRITNIVENSDSELRGSGNITHIEDEVQDATNYDFWFEKFTRTVNNDLDTAGAIAELNNLIKEPNISATTKIKLIEKFDEVLGLELVKLAQEKFKILQKSLQEPIPDEIRELAEKRLIARENKNWAESDKLRDEIKMKGYEIKDEGNTYTLHKALI